MPRISPFPLKIALLGAMTIGASGLATAQPAAMQQAKGKVAQYSLTPRGTVDGLILTDGTEVMVPPHMATAMVFAIHPADAVTVRGQKIGTGPVVTAVAVTNDATGAVIDTSPPEPPRRMNDEGRVKLQLHDRQGRLNGVLLEDGTTVRMPPDEAARHATGLAIGQSLYARGNGVADPLGKVIAAREIGPNSAQLSKVSEPAYKRWMHEVFGDDGKQRPAPPKNPS